MFLLALAGCATPASPAPSSPAPENLQEFLHVTASTGIDCPDTDPGPCCTNPDGPNGVLKLAPQARGWNRAQLNVTWTPAVGNPSAYRVYARIESADGPNATILKSA